MLSLATNTISCEGLSVHVREEDRQPLFVVTLEVEMVFRERRGGLARSVLAQPMQMEGMITLHWYFHFVPECLKDMSSRVET